MKPGECRPKCFDAFKSQVSLRFLVVVIGFAFRLREWGNWPCGIIQLRLVRQSGGGLIICLELAMVSVGDLCLKLDSLNCIDYTLVCFITNCTFISKLRKFSLVFRDVVFNCNFKLFCCFPFRYRDLLSSSHLTFPLFVLNNCVCDRKIMFLFPAMVLLGKENHCF